MTHFLIDLRLVTAVAILVNGVGISAAAQSSLKCRAADDRSANMISELKRFISATDAKTVNERNNMMHLPVAASNEVKLVTDEKVCAKVVQAYSTLPNPYTPTRLYVVKIGNKGYVGYDPDRRVGEFSAVYVFSTKYARTGGWVGG